jgi:protein involved in polysaccharide export with SLBB domain
VLRDLAGGEGKLALPLPANDTADDLAGDIALEPGDVIIVPRLDRVYVIGRIIRPGALNLPSQEQLTISRAISLSGGFDKFANQDAVQLMREGRVSTVDVRAILAGKTQDPPLRPGDTVYVQESRF